MRNVDKRFITALIALLLIVLLTSLGYADSREILVGHRFECMYEIVGSERRLISNPDERPYVEFFSNQKCEYKDGGDNCTYTVAGKNILVVEAGAFPMVSFEQASDGRLRLDGLGLANYWFEDYDEWYYDTFSEEYAQLDAVAVEMQEARAQDIGMGSLERIEEILPFRNGYACVVDEDNNYHYIDCNGDIVLSVDDKYLSRYYWPIDGGVTMIHMDDSTYHMVDLNGNVIKEFVDYDYAKVGAPSEGYICAVRKNVSLEGTSYCVEYYDLSGQKHFSFENVSMIANGLSNFSNGRAFLLNEGQAGRDDDQYILIDTEGNRRELAVGNRDEIIPLIREHYMHSTYDPDPKAKLTLKSTRISEVTPFGKGERNAAVLIEVVYEAEGTNSYGREYSNTYSNEYVGAVSLDGKVKALCEAYSYSPCVNGAIMIQDERSTKTYWKFYSVDGKTLIDVTKIPALSNGKGHAIFFMDNGQFLVSMNNGEFFAVINQRGEVIKEPVRSKGFYFSDTDMFGNGGERYISECSIGGGVNTKEYIRIINRDLIAGYESSGSNSPAFRYVDITGEMVAGPYVHGINFVNGYALVVGEKQKNKTYKSSLVGGDLHFINSKGERVEKIDLELPESHKRVNTEAMWDTHNPVNAEETIKTVLNTDQSFRSAFNAALPNTIAGEICGYIYDLATLESLGLGVLSHAYNDLTHAYRKEAAQVIEKALITNYDIEDVESVFDEINKVLKSEGVGTIKSFKNVVSKIEKGTNELISHSNYPDDKFEVPGLKGLSKTLASISYFSKFIDAMDAGEEQKLIIAVLVSNYADNLSYVQECYWDCVNYGNTEMAEIYNIVYNDLKRYYGAFIEGSLPYIVEQGLSYYDFEFVMNTAKTIESLAGGEISKKFSLSAIFEDMKENKKLTDAEFNRANMVLLTHSIVVSFSKAVGTDKTYDAMQKLYENAIVINAMVEDVSEELKKAGNNEDVLKNKTLALAEYRLITLDNLRAYHDNCFSGEVFLDRDKMMQEEEILKACIEYLTSESTSVDKENAKALDNVLDDELLSYAELDRNEIMNNAISDEPLSFYADPDRNGIVDNELSDQEMLMYETVGFQVMKVAIAVDDNGKIQAVEVVEHSETPGFGADVIADKAVFDELIGQDIVTARIDVKAGVTLTSNAINNALKQASLAEEATETEEDAKEVSVYETTGFQAMKVAIAVDEDGRIRSVEVVEHSETPGFGADVIADKAVFDELVGQNIATAQIDTKAGVTLTSNAINNALEQAAEVEGGAKTEAETEADAEEVPVYEAVGFQAMKVAIAVDESGKINSIEFIEHNETPGMGAELIKDKTVFAELVGQDIATAQIDVRSGVTLTSNAINEALKQAASHESAVSCDIYVRTIKDKVNFRDRASSSGTTLGRISKDVELLVLDQESNGSFDWYRVEYEGNTGYVRGDMVKISD